MQNISEINKLIHKMMKAQNPEDEKAFGLICLMGNHIMTKNQVEEQIDLQALCDKYNVDYCLVIEKEHPDNAF